MNNTLPIRWVQVLKLTRRHALAIGYPREAGGWEICQPEDLSIPAGFYAEADCLPAFVPGDQTIDGVLVCLFPEPSGWRAICRIPGDSDTVSVDPFCLMKAKAGKRGW